MKKSDCKKEKKLVYVIQKHHASRLHYDLRLQQGKVLKSWAVPKEPPKSMGVKRLAIAVEDHDLDYASFEGEIAEGVYGAGKVEIWDSGFYEPLQIMKDRMVVRLHGRQLNGVYCLIRLKPRPGEKNVNWLFFKKKDNKKEG